MKTKILLFILFMLCLSITSSMYAQIGITSISTGSSNLPALDPIFNRKGAGIQSGSTGLDGRWDSVGTNYNILFNGGASDSTYITNVTISSLGLGSRLPITAIAKVRRVNNLEVQNTGDHFSFWTTSDAEPLASSTTGNFILNGPQVTSVENALVSNNINTGLDNVFQNNSQFVHYGNIERIDFIIPNGYIIAIGSDLNKIGFTLFDKGVGDAFKIGGIRNVNASNDPTDYITPLLSVLGNNFGNNLLANDANYVIFQKDPEFYRCEPRPSVKVSSNIRGVFISLADLGFSAGQTVYGFSLFANDVPSASSTSYLQDFMGFPTNTSSGNMLDLVNSIGLYSLSQSVLASSLTLKATLQNSKVLLQWNNESLLNADKIFLQRANQSMQYNNIVELNLNQGSYVDDRFDANVAYYRLKLIMRDGSVKYSNIQFISTKVNFTQIYPTIANNVLYVKSNSIGVGKLVSVSVYSVEGKLMQTENYLGNNFMSIDINNLKKGMYFVVLTQHNEIIINQKIQKN